MKFRLTFLIVCGFLSVSCNEGILGPSDNPYLEKKWVSITVKYWVKVSKEETKSRTFTLTDKEVIQKNSFQRYIGKVSGSSTGVGDQLVILDSKGGRWHGEIIFENRIKMGSAADSWYVHYIELTNYDFYNWLIDLCLKNEKLINDRAQAVHIILRLNKSLSDYPILK